jgi:hypothetical protein
MKLVEELHYVHLDENTRKLIQSINTLSKKKKLSVDKKIFLTTSVRQLLKDDPKNISHLRVAIKRLGIKLEEL